ncbi:hypothetical protein ACIQD3_22730 [Peribacillus loiseleuriae]|uniref:hypothetical protein n=1 Tax=Peribacillus loiseleuriae TaxID=1679170 RepID=UPI00382541B4
MGSMFSWATREHLLDHMSLEQIFMYYDYGVEFEENKSNILVSRIAVGLFGAEEPKKPKEKDYDDTPDREAFYKQYGDRIKRPEGVKE